MSADGVSAPALNSIRPVLVTGGAGFIGCNLADRLAREGHDVVVYDALARAGVEQNLAWLKRRHPHRISAVVADVRDASSLDAVAHDASAVFHLAAQVAVTTSLTAPVEDFDVNVRSTLSLLESVRAAGARTSGRGAPVIFASTNKVYGDLADIEMTVADGAYAPLDPQVRRFGVCEERPLDFHTPYGCSKGAADQYVLDYARSFGLPTAVLRMSCIYGPRQMGTEDQGWVAHFLISALQGEAISIYGDGRQVRDILHVDDAVEAYMAVWRDIGRVSGQAFNLGGGPSNAVSLRQLLAHIRELVGREVKLDFSDWRAGDQRYFVADTRRIQAELGLKAAKGWRRGVAELAAWLAEARGLKLPEAVAEAAE
jgi:CDP-paratose 2-epimerase